MVNSIKIIADLITVVIVSMSWIVMFKINKRTRKRIELEEKKQNLIRKTLISNIDSAFNEIHIIKKELKKAKLGGIHDNSNEY